MPRVKVLRSGRVTLPAAARKALDLREGDDLEVEVRAGTLVLKPATVVDRQRALEQMSAAKARVRPTAEQARKSPEEQEREIFDEVKAMRREYAQSRSR